MEQQQLHYWWGRLLRAHVREGMTDAQRSDLANAISADLPTDKKLNKAQQALSDAAVALESGVAYDIAAWLKAFSASKPDEFDADAYRAAQAPRQETPLEERLSALLAGDE